MSARPTRPRRRRRGSRLLIAGIVALAFGAGVGLGQALRDGPSEGSQTLVRTLRPLSLVPVVQATVTVTTTAP